MKRTSLLFVGVALAYAAGSQLAYSWFGASGPGASFFPAAGVTLAALVLTERRLWPVVLAAAATAELVLDLLHGIDLLPTLGYVAANVSEPLVGALLLTAVVAHVDLSRTRDLAAFLLCAVAAGPAVGAAVGASTNVLLADGDDWLRFAGQWWVGDGLGVLVVAGSALAVRSEHLRPLGRTRLAEGLVLATLGLVATVLVFWFDWLALVYLPIALLVVIAFRVGTAGVALTGAAIAFLAAEATAEGYTFWDSLDVSPSTGVVYLQLGLGISIASSLALAAEIAQRERAATAWAGADAARRESATVAAHADRLRSLAENAGHASTRGEVAAALERHGFAGVVGLPPVGSIEEAPDRYLRESGGRIARDAYARVELLQDERKARMRAELLQRHAAGLAAAATVDEVAAWSVSLLEQAGLGITGVERLRGETVEVLAVSGVSAEATARFDAYPVDADTPGAAAIREAEIVEVRSSEEYDARFPGSADMRAAHGVEAIFAVPLRDSGGRVVGALSAAFTDAAMLDEPLRQLLRGIAEQTGVALERALAFAAEQEARERAEELERRAARLQEVTASLAASRTTQELARAVVAELIPAVGGMGGSIFVHDEAGGVLRMIEDQGYPADVLDRHRVVPIDAQVPLAEAFREGRPLLFRDVDELRARYPGLAEDLGPEHGAAFADIPLVAGLRKVGHLAVAFPSPRAFDGRERTYLFAATDAASQALARVLLDEAEREARWRAELLELHAKHLAAASSVQEVLDATIDVLTGIHTVTICLLEGETVVIGASNGLTDETRVQFARFPLSTKTLVAEVMRSGTAIEVGSGVEYDERFPEGAVARSAHGSESLRCVPIASADGRVQATLTMSAREQDWFTDSRRQVLDGMAEQMSLALGRARLHERAERTAEEATLLIRLADVLERGTTATARAQSVVDFLAHELGIGAAVQILDEDDASPRVLAQRAVPASAEGAEEAIPLRARGRTLGTLEICGGADFARSVLGREIVSRVSVALDNALLYDRERVVSHTLQLGLLGGSPAGTGTLELAASYRAGTAALDVGGDWYDAFPLPDGTVALVIGDVVGHGLDAAIVMGQLRGAVRALAPAFEPARLLEHLDIFVETLPDAGMATIAFIRIDPISGRMRYACAGHPPPLLLAPGKEPRYLWDGRSAAIGSILGVSREQADAELAAGETLVLYTDGVIERRNESLDAGFERLARAATEPRAPHDLVEHLPDVLLEGQTQDDDACVLAARRTAVETRFVHAFPAAPSELSPLRARLREWLETAGIPAEVVDGTVLGVSEAAANSIEHGLGFDASATVTVEAAVTTAGWLEVSVRDDGSWREANGDPNRGHGLKIMEAMMDGVSVDRLASGTVVRLTRELARIYPA